MKHWKITYWSRKLNSKNHGYRSITIEAETEEEATNEFMDLIINANDIGYCNTVEQ